MACSLLRIGESVEWPSAGSAADVAIRPAGYGTVRCRRLRSARGPAHLLIERGEQAFRFVCIGDALRIPRWSRAGSAFSRARSTAVL